MAVNAARRDTVSAGRRRTVSILGSTGSVGANTVDLIMRNRERFEVEALVAGGNCDKLAGQARRLRPRRAVIADDARLSELRRALAGTGIETAAGRAAVLEAANQPADWVMAAIVGAAGLEPTLAAIRRGAIVALANKECLVCAGELLTAEVRRAGSRLLPVDSEHSAIFQVFDFERRDRVEKIVLTASGGPFRTLTREQMASVTPEQAVAHPNWSMGAKISVDSATMMNKGLELIEAHHLFEMPSERIDILVHPQSVVHSMVSYVDGSVLAQLGSPDMRTPIAYALAWPDRMVTPTTRLDLAALGQLTFEPPDPKRFPGLDLARQALQQGGGAPTILNAANEIAVAGFLGRRIRFLDIIEVVARTLDRLSTTTPATLADIRALDEEARRVASEAMPA
ncbi:MAG TPA: 1-deoxy-D-xylulose-5-phosphate reductoisomerase [Alphaproteobacteria bacterium]|nr:1-deoxy-D-xylulose-5-phosphate reductoisomerase [Alphaproteobacteria bacterium]